MRKLELNIELMRYISKKLKKEGEHWIWLGACSGGRKPTITVSGKVYYVTRIVWEFINGPIPEGLHVCHKCDIPKCLNTSHLFLGTHRQNMEDKASKLRGTNKLDKEQISEVLYRLKSGEKANNIAKDFGVSQTTISNLRNCKSYQQVVSHEAT